MCDSVIKNLGRIARRIARLHWRIPTGGSGGRIDECCTMEGTTLQSTTATKHRTEVAAVTPPIASLEGGHHPLHHTRKRYSYSWENEDGLLFLAHAASTAVTKTQPDETVPSNQEQDTPTGRRHGPLVIEENAANGDSTTWPCLYCGEADCYYVRSSSNGRVDKYEVEEEWDSREHRPVGNQGVLCLPATMVVVVFDAVMASKGLFAANKFITSPRLEPKLRTWIPTKVSNIVITNDNWIPLRRVVKDTLRCRRIWCIGRMHDIYKGKSYSNHSFCESWQVTKN